LLRDGAFGSGPAGCDFKPALCKPPYWPKQPVHPGRKNGPHQQHGKEHFAKPTPKHTRIALIYSPLDLFSGRSHSSMVSSNSRAHIRALRLRLCHPLFVLCGILSAFVCGAFVRLLLASLHLIPCGS